MTCFRVRKGFLQAASRDEVLAKTRGTFLSPLLYVDFLQKHTSSIDQQNSPPHRHSSPPPTSYLLRNYYRMHAPWRAAALLRLGALIRAQNAHAQRQMRVRSDSLLAFVAHQTRTCSTPYQTALCAAAATFGCGAVLAEVGEAAAGGTNWSQLVGRLHAGGWDVSHSKHTTNGGADARYELSLRAEDGADMHAVLVALVAAFADTSPAALLSAADAPSGATLIIQSGAFTFDIAVPRVPSFDSRVTLVVEAAGAVEPVFSCAQVAALERSARLASKPTPDSHADLAIFDEDGNHVACRNPLVDAQNDSDTKRRTARQRLAEMGVEVLDAAQIRDDWDSVAGYDEVKRRIEDALVLPLRHPGVFDEVARGTRTKFASNVPGAVLYSGPPGCGKTLCARVLAGTVGVPFVHVPLESLLSKYYGETTRRLSAALEAANDLGRCIVFVDEADALGAARDGGGGDSDVHEVTRRTLSVLLRFLDGVDGPRDAILLAATNCADSLDPALLSRFDIVVRFPPPDEETRSAILALYAKHLKEEERALIARVTDGFSGRELLDMCEDAERSHAGRVVRKEVKSDSLPSTQDYVDAAKAKNAMTVKAVQERNNGKRVRRGRSPLRPSISA